MAYNPINTKGSPAGGSPTDGIAAPESMRTDIYNSAGIPEFYGVSIMEMNELGAGQKFNTVFNGVKGSTYSSFNGATQEIIIGLDRSRESLIRAVATDADSGSEFTLTADDQYSIRQNKIGYFGSLEEGRMVLDNRALVGIIASGISA
jgi:hypothetical protein